MAFGSCDPDLILINQLCGYMADSGTPCDYVGGSLFVENIQIPMEFEKTDEGYMSIVFDPLYGKRTSIQLLMNSLDLETISNFLKGAVEVEKAGNKAMVELLSRKKVAKDLANRINMETAHPKGTGSYVDKTAKLRVKIDKPCTEEQARKLLTLAAEIFK